MFRQNTIRRITAAALLLVFSFSITPTILLHNWLADHTDTVKKTGSPEQDHISTKKFYCHCDNIVAESPFTEVDEVIVPIPEKIFSIEQGSKTVQPVSSQHLYFALRGPPVV
ncbi:MAG TPA: hypothetical protein PLZ45_04955 [Ferruginibacter sp.]|nr:hypothetical protein [Chitinophagaceae bacterium]HRI23998.1 hypothetical protein [Ferruginibacter sp.]